MFISNIPKAPPTLESVRRFLEKQLGDDVVMDSLLDLGIVTAISVSISGTLTAFLLKLGMNWKQEAYEQRKEIWSLESTLDRILEEFKFREVSSAIIDIIEYFDKAWSIRKNEKLDEIKFEQQYLDKIRNFLEILKENIQIEQDENTISIILEMVKFLDEILYEKKKIQLKNIVSDSIYGFSSNEEIELKLEKLNEVFQEEDKIKKTYFDSMKYCEQAGWFLMIAAPFLLIGIPLAVITLGYISISPILLIFPLGIFIFFFSLAIKKYHNHNQLEKIKFNYMKYLKLKPYYKRTQGGD